MSEKKLHEQSDRDLLIRVNTKVDYIEKRVVPQVEKNTRDIARGKGILTTIVTITGIGWLVAKFGR